MSVRITFFLIFIFVWRIYCKEPLINPCNYNDLECMKRVADSIFGKSGTGMPEYGIISIDPMEIRKVTYTDPGSGIVTDFENIKIIGLKNETLTDFQLDKITKAVLVILTFDVDVTSNVAMKFTEDDIMSGTFKAKASVIVNVRYFYDLKVGSDGVEHFIVGPENNTCETVGVPEITLDLQYPNTVVKDPDVAARRADYVKRAAGIKQKSVCAIIADAYKIVVENCRSAFKIMPKTSLFLNV